MSPKAGGKSSLEKDGKGFPKKKKKGMTVKQLRDIHLKDKDHVITDQEMKDLELDLTVPDTSTAHTPEIADDKERPKDEDKDPKIITPWDTIKE